MRCFHIRGEGKYLRSSTQWKPRIEYISSSDIVNESSANWAKKKSKFSNTERSVCKSMSRLTRGWWYHLERRKFNLFKSSPCGDSRRECFIEPDQVRPFIISSVLSTFAYDAEAERNLFWDSFKYIYDEIEIDYLGCSDHKSCINFIKVKCLRQRLKAVEKSFERVEWWWWEISLIRPANQHRNLFYENWVEANPIWRVIPFIMLNEINGHDWVVNRFTMRIRTMEHGRGDLYGFRYSLMKFIDREVEWNKMQIPLLF